MGLGWAAELTSTSPKPVLWWVLLTSLPRASVSQAEPQCTQADAVGPEVSGVCLYLPMRLAAPVPVLSCTSTKSKLQSSCDSRLKLWKCRSMTWPTGTEICQRHSCRAEAASDTREAGQGHPQLSPVGGCLPPCLLSPSTLLPPPSCWHPFSHLLVWVWLGMARGGEVPLQGGQQPPTVWRDRHTCSFTPCPSPFTLSPHCPSLCPLAGCCGGCGLQVGSGPPLCFRLQLASSLLSKQSWKPSQMKPRWRQSPWSHKCSSQAQLSAAQAEMVRLLMASHWAPSPAQCPRRHGRPPGATHCLPTARTPGSALGQGYSLSLWATAW